MSPAETLKTDLVPIIDDTEPLEAPREDVEMRRTKMKNPSTSREEQEHEDSGRAVYRSWCAARIEGRGVGGQHRMEIVNEEERDRTIDCCF